VAKDAKYSVRHPDGRICLMYSTADGERWHMTTKAHPELADMVNDVKRTYGRGPNGPFYINEYKQVIVPVGDDAQYYLAGTYDQPLRFKFEVRQSVENRRPLMASRSDLAILGPDRMQGFLTYLRQRPMTSITALSRARTLRSA